jgi:hypothetical protein
LGQNKVSSSGADNSAPTRVPLSAIPPRPTSRSIATSAPIFRRDRNCAASTSASISSSTWLDHDRNSRVSPRRISARRSSGWKTTTVATEAKIRNWRYRNSIRVSPN